MSLRRAEVHEELIRDPLPASAGRLILSCESGKAVDMGIATEVSNRFCQQFGSPDAQFYSDPQFRLEKADLKWFVIPSPSAKNQTMLNGKAITERQPVAKGDVLAVGNESKGIIKLPLTVDFQV